MKLIIFKNMFFLIVLFLILGVLFGVFAFSGIAIAVAIPFFTKLLFFTSFLCFMTAVILIIIEKLVSQSKTDKIIAIETKEKKK